MSTRFRAPRARQHLVSFTLFLVLGCHVGVWAVQLGSLAAALRLPPAGLGVALSGAALGGILALFVGGRIADRFGRRAVLLTGFLATGAAFALLGAAGTFGQVVAVVVLYGLSVSFVELGANAVGADYEAAHDVQALTGLQAGFSLGAVLGALGSGTLLALGFDYRLVYVGLAVVFLGTAGWVARVRLPHRNLGGPRTGAPEPRGPLLRLPGVLLAVAVVTVCFFGDGALEGFLAVFLRQALASGVLLSGVGIAGYHAASLTGRLVADRVLRRVPTRRVIAACGLLAALGLAVAVLAPGSGTAIAGLLLVGLALSPVVPSALSLAARSAPGRADRAVALTTAVGYSAFLVGPLVVGGVADAAGLRTGSACWSRRACCSPSSAPAGPCPRGSRLRGGPGRRSPAVPGATWLPSRRWSCIRRPPRLSSRGPAMRHPGPSHDLVRDLIRNDASRITLDVLAGVLAALIVVAIVSAVVRQVARRRRWPDRSIARMRRPFRLLLVLIGAWIGVSIALFDVPSLPLPVADTVNRSFEIAVALVGAWFAIAVVSFLVDLGLGRYRTDVRDNSAARRARTQVIVVRRVATAVIVVVAFSVILLSFPEARTAGTSLLASAGVVSVIAGVAAQQTLGNVVAGVQLAFSGAIRVDDVVIANGEWGRIEEITLTYVVVHIWDDRRMVLPSTYFTTTPFENWTRTGSELLQAVEFDLDWLVDPAAMRDEMHRVLARTDLWDGRTAVLQVTDAIGGFVRVRILITAVDAPTLFDLRCFVREEMVRWLHHESPRALPITRVVMAGTETMRDAGPRHEGAATRRDRALFSGDEENARRADQFTGPVPTQDGADRPGATAAPE